MLQMPKAEVTGLSQRDVSVAILGDPMLPRMPPVRAFYGDTIAIHEYVVAVFAWGLLVVAVTQIHVTPLAPESTDEALSPIELQWMSGALAQQLRDRAATVRESGLLNTLIDSP